VKAESDPIPSANRASYDVLLVDDNVVTQGVACKILEHHGGHAVELVENGSLAIDAFKARVAQQKPFDIILVRFVHIFLSLGSTNQVADGCLDARDGRS
jgi:hypothetical protein